MYEKDQKILKLLYGLRYNNSPAVYGLKERAAEILDINYVEYDRERKLYYYKDPPPIESTPKTSKRVGRPPDLSQAQKQEIKQSDRPHVELSRVYKVSEKLIRLIRKGER
jgi:hypothetical protein